MWENALRTAGTFVMVNVAETLGKFQSCVKKKKSLRFSKENNCKSDHEGINNISGFKGNKMYIENSLFFGIEHQ